MNEEKGYLIALTDNTDSFYIPNALHVERNDSLVPWAYSNDEEASRAAEQDGVKLIYGMENVHDGVYIDTPENRKLIENHLNSNEIQEKKSILSQLDNKTIKQSEKQVYFPSFATAQQNGEVEQYRESKKLNTNCAKAIDNAIRENFDGSRLNADGVKGVIKEFGIERVNIVLANTMQDLDYDGRFSKNNKEWAKGIVIPEQNRDSRVSFMSKAHPAILDGFVNQVRREVAEHKPSINDQLKSDMMEKPLPKTNTPKKQNGLEL